MAGKTKSAEQTDATDATVAESPEARLDDKLKAMFEAIERRSGSNVLPDLGSLPRARSTTRRN